MRWALLCWNLLLTFGLALTMFHSVTQRLALDISTLRVAALTVRIQTAEQDIATLRGGSTDTLRAVDLLSDQCELVLDMLVSANRGGWWSDEMLRVRTQMQQIKRERGILNGIFN